MRSINISNKQIKQKRKKKSILFPLFLATIGIFTYFMFTDKDGLLRSIGYIFSKKNFVSKYETYDIYLKDLGEDLDNEIISSLEIIQFEEKSRFNFIEKEDKADIVLEYGSGENTIYSQYLLPVGHMYWIEDSVSAEDIEGGKYTLLLSTDTYNQYYNFLKEMYPDVEIKSSENLISDLEDEDSGYLGLIEKEDLAEEYKLLEFDNKYYLDTFDGGVAISIALVSQDEDVNVSFVSNIIKKNLSLSSEEFNAENIAKVNMTGVTALARRVAQAMAVRNDYEYPAEKIASFLSDADLTHTSNEISFVDGCTTYSGMRFCSSPKSIETLKAIGADLIELTGNHNNDFGSSYNTSTIETYIDEGIGYFGGGLDDDDASQPYIVETDGTSIAFLGYNYYDSTVGNPGALATSTHAGANSYSDEKVKKDIQSIRKEVDVIIVDFQFQECYCYPSSDVIYPVCYKPISNQSKVFRAAIDYGADIVIGTQAHQPQTYELYGDGVIFYGLGNLFFDQSMWIGTRQGMILTHYFMDGELIQTKITPTIYDSSLQVEIADEEDADLLLELLATARESL
ncbi:MAG: CapA family protein [Candidatus Dojkabacteria bacterium]|nr:CapA family protein [Candidatus Dojkabacteria bacterium]